MPTVSTKRNQRSLDDRSQDMLYEGLNLSQLAVAFRLATKTIQYKLHNVPPDGIRNGSKVWRINTVAEHLVKPKQDIEQYIKNMPYTDLPKHLSKEFWNGQRAKQEYELKAGDLWPTTKVVANVSELYKLMSMSLKLLSDTMARQTELTPKQRKIVQEVVDATQRDLQKTIREKFSMPEKEEPPKPAVPAQIEEDDDDSL